MCWIFGEPCSFGRAMFRRPAQQLRRDQGEGGGAHDMTSAQWKSQEAKPFAKGAQHVLITEERPDPPPSSEHQAASTLNPKP